MNKEIKEILEGIEVVIKHDGTLEFNAKELKTLLDYINNTTMDFAYQLNDAIDELGVLRKYVQSLSPSNLKIIEKQITKIENILKGE